MERLKEKRGGTMTDEFNEDETAILECVLPSIQTAIRFGDGQIRIQLDISEQYLEEAKKLLNMNNQLLDVMIKIKDQSNELTETAIPYTKEDGTFKATDIKLID